MRVGLQRLHVARAELARLAEHAVDLVRAVAGIEEVRRGADVVRVAARDLPLVGRPDDAVGRVVRLRDVVVRDGAGHVIFAGARHRQPGLAFGDLRVVAGGDQTDVAFVVGIDEVVGGRVPAAKGLAKLMPVARAAGVHQHAEVLRR